jgi:hypothetical protein
MSDNPDRPSFFEMQAQETMAELLPGVYKAVLEVGVHYRMHTPT